MPVTKLFIIGSITVPSSWIALIVGFVVAYGAIRMYYGKIQATVLSDAFFNLVIVWKLAVILTNFSTVIRAPLSILYFHGGLVGFYLGLIVVIGKVLLDRKKGRIGGEGMVALFTGAVIVQVVFQVMMAVLNEGGLVAQVVTVVLFTLFGLFFWVNSVKGGVWLIQLAMLFMAVHFFIAAFQPAGLIGTPLVTTCIIGLFFTVLFSMERRKLNA